MNRTISLGVVIFILAAIAMVPVHAISYLDVTPDAIYTGGFVTITLNFVTLGPDTVTSLKVTDPLGNIFQYTASLPTLDSGNPTWSTTFPSANWQRISGPGGNTGTDVSGTYEAEARYDTYLDARQIYDNFSCGDSFNVPEFSFTIPLATSLATVLYLAIRKRRGKTERAHF